MTASLRWTYEPLCTLATAVTGFAFPSEGFTTHPIGTRLVRGINVKRGKLDWSEGLAAWWPDDADMQNLNRYALEPNDIVVAMDGAQVGKSYAKITTSDVPSFLVQRVARLRAISPGDEVFIKQILSSTAFIAHIDRVKTNTAVPHVTLEDICGYRIAMPSSEERLRIGLLLEEWDTAIDKAEQLIAAKSTRLDHQREHYLNKPKDSQRVKLHEVTRESTARNGKSLGREAIMAVTKQSGMRPMREETIAASIERYKIVRPNAFAYNPMRLNIGSIAMSSFDDDVLVSPDYVVFECHENKLLCRYLNHLRRTRLWASHFEAAGSGGVRIRIYYDDLAAFSFWLPEPDVQQRIVALLEACATEIETLERYRAALQAQKRGLMQKLLTGQWRVKTEDERVPA